MDPVTQDSIAAMAEALKGAKFVQPFQNDAPAAGVVALKSC